MLRRFVGFAEVEQAQTITAALFLRWQNTIGQARQQTRAGHFGMVRLFAQWLHGLDPTCEVLPQGLFPTRHRRPGNCSNKSTLAFQSTQGPLIHQGHRRLRDRGEGQNPSAQVGQNSIAKLGPGRQRDLPASSGIS
nr:hypothetical protein [uncultured Rhodopila sp.]